MADDYPSALAAVASGTPLSYLEYISLVLAQSASGLQSTQYTLDNSNSYWDSKQANGNTVACATDPTNKTVYFCHVNYVGPQVSGTMGSLALPAKAMSALAAAANTSADDYSGWALIAAGAIIIAAVLLAPVTFGGSLLVLYAGYFFAVGLGLVVLGALVVAFTPQVVSTTCNPDNTSCCLVTTSLTGQVNSCFNCAASGENCTSTTTSAGGLGGLLTTIAIATGVVIGVGVGGYALYKVVQHHYANRPLPPPPPPR